MPQLDVSNWSELGKPAFLSVKCGDFVVISYPELNTADWWVGQVINRVGNSVDPNVNTLFQVIDVDTGRVQMVNADVIWGIVQSKS